jgi:hypothetical protein
MRSQPHHRARGSWIAGLAVEPFFGVGILQESHLHVLCMEGLLAAPSTSTACLPAVQLPCRMIAVVVSTNLTELSIHDLHAYHLSIHCVE